jgi:hypothetical protein
MMSGDFAGQWSFKQHPWLKEMHDTRSPVNVGQKSAQMGYTEAMINIAFFQMDVMNRDVLYILPNSRPVATDFSVSRIDKSIELSPHLAKLFNSTSNTGHKRAGSTNLYIRGANSRSGLKSIPVSTIIFDEFDEMPEDSISLAEERSSGQVTTLDWKISTPTTPEFGINVLFEQSTQEHYQFPCPSCNKFIELKFPDNLVITAEDAEDPKILNTHLICGLCKNKLPHEDKNKFYEKAVWVPNQPNRLTRGFYINQLYSTALQPYKIAKLYLGSLSDVFKEQEFFNSKMGLPHIVAGAKIDDTMLNDLIKDYGMLDGCRSNYVTTMGVDVGRVIHIEITGWDVSKCNPLDINADAIAQVLWAGEVKDFHQLDQLMTAYAVKSCVIDIAPETRAAEEFAKRFYGRVRCCRYVTGIMARSLTTAADNDRNDIYVNVNRTAWLDQSLGRIRNKSILFPNNLPKDYFNHLKAIVRRPYKDKNGNPGYKYEAAKDDHFAHARNYSEIALPFAVGTHTYLNSSLKI